MDKTAQTIAQRIRATRTSKKLTQQDLADAMKITVQSVSQWETGRTQPDFDRAVLLARVLGVNWSWLIAGEGSPDDQLLAFEEARTELEKRFAPVLSLDEIPTYILSSIARLIPDDLDDDSIFCRYQGKGRLFSWELPDDELAPLFRRGDIAVFDSGVPIRPGDFVLVKHYTAERLFFRQIASISLNGDDPDHTVADLRSPNPEHESIRVELDDHADAILAVMIEHRRFRRH